MKRQWLIVSVLVVVVFGACASSPERPDARPDEDRSSADAAAPATDPPDVSSREASYGSPPAPGSVVESTPADAPAERSPEPSSSAVPAGDGQFDPEQAWNVTYDVRGEIRSRAWSLEVPEQMTMSWHPNEHRELPPSIWLQGDHYESNEWRYAMGLQLDVADPQGNRIDTIWTTLPSSRGRGTVTQGFLFQEPISWRGLRPGTSATGVATSGDERCDGTVRRDSETRWTIDLTCEGPSGVLEVELHTSSPSPPWSNIRLSFTAKDSSGSYSGWFELDQAARR